MLEILNEKFAGQFTINT